MWSEHERKHAVHRNSDWACDCRADMSGRTDQSSVSARVRVGDSSGEDLEWSCRLVYANRLEWPLQPPGSPRHVHGCRGDAKTVATLLADEGDRDSQPHDPCCDLVRYGDPVDGRPWLRPVFLFAILVNSGAAISRRRGRS